MNDNSNFILPCVNSLVHDTRPKQCSFEGPQSCCFYLFMEHVSGVHQPKQFAAGINLATVVNISLVQHSGTQWVQQEFGASNRHMASIINAPFQFTYGYMEENKSI